jgi:hypothetical protein
MKASSKSQAVLMLNLCRGAINTEPDKGSEGDSGRNSWDFAYAGASWGYDW